ncbi:hypothetical protein C8Q75DRAFT_865598, partial [Abortiporus biennis]
FIIVLLQTDDTLLYLSEASYEAFCFRHAAITGVSRRASYKVNDEDRPDNNAADLCRIRSFAGVHARLVHSSSKHVRTCKTGIEEDSTTRRLHFAKNIWVWIRSTNRSTLSLAVCWSCSATTTKRVFNSQDCLPDGRTVTAFPVSPLLVSSSLPVPEAAGSQGGVHSLGNWSLLSWSGLGSVRYIVRSFQLPSLIVNTRSTH